MLDTLEGRVFAAVLFDMDGTLIDSHPAVERSWVRWAQEHDVPLSSFAGMHGRPAADIVALFLPPERREAAFRRIEQLETEDTDGVVVLPGTVDALAALPPGRAAIVTSCTAPLARARIGASGLVQPSVLVTADQVTAGKPAPDPYLLAAQRLGVSAAQCLVVEDAPAGLAAGRAAGAATLAVTVTHKASELDADAVVETLADVRFVVGDGGVRVVAPSG
ncbi:HAD-IA family hydrolase [Spongisporangium articulatum]|uniref:HAD-IA family hydrolase n=1 Tax=Spongisporangium articulatum TaxID=3362603 RepID=A0ABW8AMQ6_9ACTN